MLIVEFSGYEEKPADNDLLHIMIYDFHTHINKP